MSKMLEIYQQIRDRKRKYKCATIGSIEKSKNKEKENSPTVSRALRTR